MTVFSVRHSTVYRYRRPLGFGRHALLFRPRDSYDQRLIESRLEVAPGPARVRWIHDVFGNCVALVDVLCGQNAVAGIVLALRERERTGRGGLVEVNLLQSLLAALTNHDA